MPTSSVESLLKDLPKRTFLAYVCLGLWIWMVFWTGVFTKNFLDSGDVEGNPFSISLVTNALAYFLIFVASRFVNPLARFRWLPWVASVLTTAGSVLNACAYWDLAAFSATGAIGSVATGIGSCLCMVLIGEQLSEQKTPVALAICAGGLLRA